MIFTYVDYKKLSNRIDNPQWKQTLRYCQQNSRLSLRREMVKKKN